MTMDIKLLNLSVYRDGTGFAHSSIDHIIAMNRVGIDVVTRPIELSGYHESVPHEIEELEKKSLDGVTHVLQHYLPQMFTWKHGVKNIGMFHVETTHFKPSKWQYYCNLMDAIVVNSLQNTHACTNSLVHKPIYNIPQPINVEIFKKEYKPLELPIKNKYVFYAIGDWSYRKNYENLIRAYLNTFSKNDDVILILKIYVSGYDTNGSAKIISDFIAGCKQKLRKYATGNFPEIIILPQRISNEEILSLHQMGHCFVSVERGSGICLPAMNAVGFGNAVIASEWGGHIDFLNTYDGTRYIRGELVPCYGMELSACPYTELYTCHEEWYELNYNHLCEQMLYTYNNRCGIKKYSNSVFMNTHNYTNVGNVWKSILCENTHL